MKACFFLEQQKEKVMNMYRSRLSGELSDTAINDSPKSYNSTRSFTGLIVLALSFTFLFPNVFAKKPATLIEESALCDFSGIEDKSKIAYTPREVRRCFKSVDFRLNDYQEAVSTFEALMKITPTAELYNSRFNWQKKLEKIKHKAQNGVYTKDLQFQKAMTSLMKLGFKNVHFDYTVPACYSEYLSAVIPLKINSMLTKSYGYHKSNQIIYIEPVEIALTQLYLDATGIDVKELFGKQIVSINGVNATEYLRNVGQSAAVSIDDNDGNNFDATLNFGAPFILFGSRLIYKVPDTLELVVKSKKGYKEAVSLPYVLFDNESGFNFTRTLPASTDKNDFAEKCYETFAMREARELGEQPQGASESDNNNNIMGPKRYLIDRQNVSKRMPDYKRHIRMMKKMKQKKRHYQSKDFSEVPMGLVGKFITEVVPADEVGQGLQYKEDTTVLKLFSFTGPSTVDTWVFNRPERSVYQTLDYACANSKRLMIDLRNNGGGAVENVSWLINHLFPSSSFKNNRNYFAPLVNTGDQDNHGIVNTQATDLHHYANAYFFYAVWLAELFNIPIGSPGPIERYPVSGILNLGLMYSLDNPFMFQPQPGSRAFNVNRIRSPFISAPPSIGLFNLSEVEAEAEFIANLETVPGQQWVAMPPDEDNPSNINNIVQSTWSQNIQSGPRGEQWLRPTRSLFNSAKTPWLYQDSFYTSINSTVPPRPYNPGIACPGKFEGKNLVIITNGRSLSASFIAAEQLRDRATLVTTGGLVNEPKGLAGARGGPVRSASDIQNNDRIFNQLWNSEDFFAVNYQEVNTALVIQVLSILGLPLSADAIDRAPWDLKDFLAATVFQNDASDIDAINTTLPQTMYIENRGSDFSIENRAIFRIIDEDTYELMDERFPILGDAHANVWTTDPQADGYVYREVIRAIKKQRRLGR